MAQANNSLKQRMEEELTCAVCCELFTNPLLLQCSHTFCKKCIQDLVRNNDEVSRYGAMSSSFKCPVCRRYINLKSIRGIDDLPENLSLANLVAMLKSGSDYSPGLRQHAPTLESTECKTHHNNIVSLFCLDCSKPLCTICSNHCHGHRMIAVDNLWKDTWKSVMLLMSEAGEKMSAINDRVQLLDDTLKAVDDQESSAKNELKAEVEILKSMLLAKLAQLNAEVHSEVHGLCHPVIHDREMCTDVLSSLESINTNIQGLQRSHDGIKSMKTLVQLENKLTSMLQGDVQRVLNRAIPVVTMPTWKLLRDSTETSIRTLIIRRTGPFPSESVVRVGASDTSRPMNTSPDQTLRQTPRDVLATDVSMTSNPVSSQAASSSMFGSAWSRPFPLNSTGGTSARVTARPVRSLSVAKNTDKKILNPTVINRLFTSSASGQASSASSSSTVSPLSFEVTGMPSSSGAASSDTRSGDENKYATFQNSVNEGVDSILNKLRKIELQAKNWDVHTNKKVKTKEELKLNSFGMTVPSSFRFGGSSTVFSADAAGGSELFSGATAVLQTNSKSKAAQAHGGLFSFGQSSSIPAFTSSAVPSAGGRVGMFGSSTSSGMDNGPTFSGFGATPLTASRRPRQASRKGSTSHSKPGNNTGFNFRLDLSSSGFSKLPPTIGTPNLHGQPEQGRPGPEKDTKKSLWNPVIQQNCRFNGFGGQTSGATNCSSNIGFNFLGAQTSAISNTSSNTGFQFTPLQVATSETDSSGRGVSDVSTTCIMRQETDTTMATLFSSGVKETLNSSSEVNSSVSAPSCTENINNKIVTSSESSEDKETGHFSTFVSDTQVQSSSFSQSTENPDQIQASPTNYSFSNVNQPEQLLQENQESLNSDVHEKVTKSAVVGEFEDISLTSTTNQSHDHSYFESGKQPDVQPSADDDNLRNSYIGASQDDSENGPNSDSRTGGDQSSSENNTDTSGVYGMDLKKQGSHTSISLSTGEESNGTDGSNEKQSPSAENEQGTTEENLTAVSGEGQILVRPDASTSNMTFSNSKEEGCEPTGTLSHKHDKYNLITDLAAALSAGSLAKKNTCSTETSPSSRWTPSIGKSVNNSASKANTVASCTSSSMAIRGPIMSVTCAALKNAPTISTGTSGTSPSSTLTSTSNSAPSQTYKTSASVKNTSSNFSFGQFPTVFNPFVNSSTNATFSFGQQSTSLENTGSSFSFTPPCYRSGWSDTDTTSASFSFGPGGRERPPAPYKLTFGFPAQAGHVESSLGSSIGSAAVTESVKDGNSCTESSLSLSRFGGAER